MQARSSSSRLPGKVLKPILGEPMLIRQIERINRCKKLSRLIVATSNEESDDFLSKELEEREIKIFRGELDDVLDRFYQAAKLYKPAHVVRLTGDCPLADPKIIDLVISEHVKNNVDYTSNISPPTYPDGLDVEIMRFSVLENVWQHATEQSDREHVTLYIRNHPEKYSQYNVVSDKDYSKLRWTVDEDSDYIYIKKIYEALSQSNPQFGFEEILEYIEENPSMKNNNSIIMRNNSLCS